jgi:outer membrane protein
LFLVLPESCLDICRRAERRNSHQRKLCVMNRNRCFTGFWTLVFAAALAAPCNGMPQQSQSITLKQAVDLAVKNSREVALAQVRYNVAENTAKVNSSAFRPSMYTGSGAAYTFGFPQTLSGAAPSIVNVSYAQTMFNPVLRGQERAALERTEGQRLELEKTRNTVMLQTSNAYLELGKVRHSLDLMRNQRQSNARIMSFTQERIKEGLESPIEATRAELAEARLEQRIVQMESSERVLNRQLAALLDIPADRRIDVETPQLRMDATLRESDLIDRALITSLDLKQSEFERRARQHLQTGEIGTKWPTADLFGNYALFGKFNHYTDFFQKFQYNNFNIGVQVRIPIMSGQRAANVALATSELNAAAMELQRKRQDVELEVGRQYQLLRELDAAHEVARLELKLAQENLQILQARFQEGRVNLRDVEQARLNENEKWVAFLDSDFAQQKAQLELMNMTGDLRQLLR